MLPEIQPIQIIDEPTMHSDISDKERSLAIPEHRFYIPTHIKEDNLEDIVKGLRKLEQEKPEAQVLVEVNTLGGDIGAATELALLMHHSPLRIATLVTNRAYSAGIAIAVAGDRGRRFAYPESDFLIHPSTYPVEGKFTLKELKESYEKKARAERRYTSLLASLTSNPEQRIIDLLSGDNYLNAEEAQALGVIDHIIPVLK